MIDKAFVARLDGHDVTVMPQNNTEKALGIVHIVEHDTGDSYSVNADRVTVTLDIMLNSVGAWVGENHA